MSKNTEWQDPYSYVTKLQTRLDGGANTTLDKALDLIKRGKHKEAADLLVSFPAAELALGCHVDGVIGTTKDGVETFGPVPDLEMIPTFMQAALARAKAPKPVEPATKPVEPAKVPK